MRALLRRLRHRFRARCPVPSKTDLRRALVRQQAADRAFMSAFGGDIAVVRRAWSAAAAERARVTDLSDAEVLEEYEAVLEATRKSYEVPARWSTLA